MSRMCPWYNSSAKGSWSSLYNRMPLSLSVAIWTDEEREAGLKPKTKTFKGITDWWNILHLTWRLSSMGEGEHWRYTFKQRLLYIWRFENFAMLLATKKKQKNTASLQLSLAASLLCSLSENRWFTEKPAPCWFASCTRPDTSQTLASHVLYGCVTLLCSNALT